MNDDRFTDAHVHTSYSQGDCKQPMDGYLALLRNGQSAGFGFADHLHPPNEAMSRIYEAMNAYRFRGDQYIADIQSAKDEGLNAYAGIEVTYEEAWDDVCRTRALDNDYDYRIVSVHSVDGFWVTRTYWQSVQPGSMFLDIVERYYDAVVQTLSIPWADVVAHIGVYRRFLPDDHPLMVFARDLIEKREDALAKACAHSGKIIEVNTSSLFKPSANTMPGDFFLTQYKKYGGKRLCLSSDAHDCKDAHQGFAETAHRLKDIGFDSIHVPWSPDTPILL